MCELPDYDFDESLDLNYMRCQYDAKSIESIDKSEESIEERTYRAVDEVRYREATRILSAPTRRVRVQHVNTPPANAHPTRVQPVNAQTPPANAQPTRVQPANAQPTRLQLLELRVQQLTYEILAEQYRIYNIYRNIYYAPSHPVASHPVASHPLQPTRPKIEIVLDLNMSTGDVASCGICMSDEIPLAKMVKTSCNHEYCDACITQIICTKPRCAFCRADITKICVNSLDVYNKF